ncbi:MAG: transposase, partial [Methanobrevibacter sp.]|nr:transposase [Methanobrevibacter sp.]
EVNYEQIKCLYAKRWEIEKSFDVLKNKLNMENITGRSKLTVEQDFHSNILIHNILQDIKTKPPNKLRIIKKINN